jgi:hypothetical protein
MYNLLGCDDVQFRDSVIIQRNISPPSSTSRSKPGNKQAAAVGLLPASAAFLPGIDPTDRIICSSEMLINFY